MRSLSDCRIRLRTRDEIRAIGRATSLTVECLRVASAALAPGVSTSRLARAAVAHAAAHGAEDVRVFASVNEQAAHGVPGPEPLGEGDVVTLDVSLRLDGWYGDAAWTYVAGRGSVRAWDLVGAAWRSSWAAVGAIRCGGRITEVARRARDVAAFAGFAVAEGCSGHGIGRSLHEAPLVTYADPSVEGWLVPGMVLTVEPVLTGGGASVRLAGGVIATEDGSLAAHFEHTVALLSTGPVLLSTGGRLWRPG